MGIWIGPIFGGPAAIARAKQKEKEAPWISLSVRRVEAARKLWADAHEEKRRLRDLGEERYMRSWKDGEPLFSAAYETLIDVCTVAAERLKAGKDALTRDRLRWRVTTNPAYQVLQQAVYAAVDAYAEEAREQEDDFDEGALAYREAILIYQLIDQLEGWGPWENEGDVRLELMEPSGAGFTGLIRYTSGTAWVSWTKKEGGGAVGYRLTIKPLDAEKERDGV